MVPVVTQACRQGTAPQSASLTQGSYRQRTCSHVQGGGRKGGSVKKQAPRNHGKASRRGIQIRGSSLATDMSTGLLGRASEREKSVFVARTGYRSVNVGMGKWPYATHTTLNPFTPILTHPTPNPHIPPNSDPPPTPPIHTPRTAQFSQPSVRRSPYVSRSVVSNSL